MKKAIQLKVRKDLDGSQQLNVIKLKGSLISNGYTEIIHITDLNEDYHINSFEIADENKNEVNEYIETFITRENLAETIVLVAKA